MQHLPYKANPQKKADELKLWRNFRQKNYTIP